MINYSEKVTSDSAFIGFVKQYFRLLRIIFGGTFLAYMLMETGAMFHLKVAN